MNQSDDTVFRGLVRKEIGAAREARDRRRDDDGSGRVLLAELTKRRTQSEELSAYVDVHDSVEILDADIGEGREAAKYPRV